MSLFFDHSHHKLRVQELDIELDVLAFHGEEHLSQPFTYRIEFTSSELDIAVDQVLNHGARFSLYAARQPPMIRGFPKPEIKPLRTVHGVITGFKRLSDSKDEARYEITLQPRLALLGVASSFGFTSTSPCRKSSNTFCATDTVWKAINFASSWPVNTLAASKSCNTAKAT